MTSVKQAVDVVLHQEDSTLSGIITNYASDRGGLTRLGLCARFHPELVAVGFFDAAKVSDADAVPIAEQAYEKCYEGPLLLDDVTNQGVGTALLSFAVNEGQREAVTLLQKSAAACGATLVVDGEIGPATVAAVNGCDPVKLVTLFCQFEVTFYQHVVAVNPSQQVNLAGWENRAAQLAKLAQNG